MLRKQLDEEKELWEEKYRDEKLRLSKEQERIRSTENQDSNHSIVRKPSFSGSPYSLNSMSTSPLLSSMPPASPWIDVRPPYIFLS